MKEKINPNIIKFTYHTNKRNQAQTYNYRKSAKQFSIIIGKLIKEILSKHQNTIYFKLNNVELLSEGSVINSSTAIGYIIEEFISKEIKKSNLSELFQFPSKTSDSAFDFIFKNHNINLFCNVKAEKQGEYKNSKKISSKSINNGIASAEAIYKLYSEKPEVPKLYLIIKIPYDIDVTKSNLNLHKEIELYYLESFISTRVKADKRSWSKQNKAISGRLNSPGVRDMKKHSIYTIPNYKKIRNTINHLHLLL